MFYLHYTYIWVIPTFSSSKPVPATFWRKKKRARCTNDVDAHCTQSKYNFADFSVGMGALFANTT